MARKVSHYVVKDGGLVCDACWGKYGEGYPPAVFPEVPAWMKRCPVCGLKITKVESLDQHELGVTPLEDCALLLYRMVIEHGGSQELSERALQALRDAGVDEDLIAIATQVSAEAMQVEDELAGAEGQDE